IQGGLYNSVVGALARLGLADAFGRSELAILALNVTYPLVPEEIRDFCRGKRAVLVLEEGQPEFIEQEILATLRRFGVDTPNHGMDVLPFAGEYRVETIARGVADFLSRSAPDVSVEAGRRWLDETAARREAVAGELGEALPPRPPNFCVGCPERPVFAALKLAQQDIGPVHVAADIGCHSFATYAPFSTGHSILGYGMSLASRAGVSPMLKRRTLAGVGDGGFWHTGLLTGGQSPPFDGRGRGLVTQEHGP